MSELIDRDAEHLRLLKLGYYMLAGITGFFALLPSLAFVLIGSLISSGAIPVAQQSHTQGDPRFFGTFMLILGLATLFAGVVGAFLTFLAARSLRDRRRWTFCIVVAILACFYLPWGTAIGVCTIIVLGRPSVKALFGEAAAQPV